MHVSLHQCRCEKAPLFRRSMASNFPQKNLEKPGHALNQLFFFVFWLVWGPVVVWIPYPGSPYEKDWKTCLGRPKPLGRTTSPIQALVYFSMGFSQVPHVRMTRPWITTPAMDAVGATFLACLQSEAVINWPGPVGTLGISTGKRTAVCWLPDFLAEFMEHEPWKQMKNHWKADMAMEHQPFLVGNRSTVDGSEILHQLRLAVYPTICWVFVHSRWCRISSINRIVNW